jgi:hypothetical protein
VADREVTQDVDGTLHMHDLGIRRFPGGEGAGERRRPRERLGAIRRWNTHRKGTSAPRRS